MANEKRSKCPDSRNDSVNYGVFSYTGILCSYVNVYKEFLTGRPNTCRIMLNGGEQFYYVCGMTS